MMIGSEELEEAWERVRENEGCAGVDGQSVHQFGKSAGKRLAALRERVSNGTYRALPLLKIVVQKKPGQAKLRTLLVPAVVDRVLQTAVARRLTQSYEEEFLDCSFAYRPGRGVDLAVARIRKYRDSGYEFVVDADIQAYFDQVDPESLLAKVGRREPERWMEGLIRQWVAGASGWDGSKVRRIRRGIPQGSPLSPVLANLYLEDFDRELSKSECKLIRYSDDFVILARTLEEAESALAKTEVLLGSAKLALNRDKTSITSFELGFRFLGVYFHGGEIWAPWKNDRPKGRVVFVAKPMPADQLRRYETAPPVSEMEEALGRVPLPRLPTQAERGWRKVAYLYLTTQGAILRKAGDRFLVEKDGEILLDLPYHKLENVLVFGNIQVTTQALGELMDKGVQLALFSRNGGYRGSMMPARGRNVLLRVAQFDRFRDAESALEAGKKIIGAKTANGAAVLERLRARDSEGAAGIDPAVRALRAASAGTASAAGLDELLGIEGAAARQYFEALMGSFNKSGFAWTGRKKHPATDPLNAMLSLTYMVLMAEIESLIEGVGLDPYLGFLHQPDYGRPSLALDLLEPFRHPVADRFVLAMANQRVVEEQDFETSDRGVVLKAGPLRTFLEQFEKWMLQKAGAGKRCLRERVRAEVEGFREWVEKGTEWEPYRWEEAAEEGETCNTWSVTT